MNAWPMPCAGQREERKWTMDQKRFGRKFRMLEECMREHENGCRDLIKKMKELPGTPPEEMRRELAEKTYRNELQTHV